MIRQILLYTLLALFPAQSEVQVQQLIRPERSFIFLLVDIPSVDYRTRDVQVNRATLNSLSVELYDTNDSLVGTANGAPNDLTNLNPIFRSIAVFSLPIPDGKFRAKVQFSVTLWQKVGQSEEQISASDSQEFEINISGNIPTLNIAKLTDGSLEICWPSSFTGWTLQSSTAESPSLFQPRGTESADGKNCLTIKASLASELFRLVN